MGKSLQQLADEYEAKFNENFPFFVVRGTDKELSDLIEKCLRDGKPYHVDYKDDELY